ncbi:MAG: hypothetical protein MH204_10645 [Fimbriimonadaceae bacterium]|nr:hypothetical protein [Fimbriimonadaceae bacterium]
MTRARVLAALAGLILLAALAGCGGPQAGAGPAPDTGAGGDAGPLLETKFDSKPVYGTFSAQGEAGLYQLTVQEDGPVTLSLKPEEGEAEEIFSGRQTQTFDGIRVVVSKAKGKPTEAEIYYKALENGYEFKSARLIELEEHPTTFQAP